MDKNTQKKKLQNILSEPLTRHRILLGSKIQKARHSDQPNIFTIQELETFINSVPDKSPEFLSEAKNVIEAVKTGLLTSKIYGLLSSQNEAGSKLSNKVNRSPIKPLPPPQS